MSSSGTFTDYLHEMTLDIGHQFFPPPTVAVPSFSITYPLDALEDEYDFKAEKYAISQYRREHDRTVANSLRIAREQEEKARKLAEQQAQQPAESPPHGGHTVISTVTASEKSTTTSNLLVASSSDSILQPSPVSTFPEPSRSRIAAPFHYLSLEDFESKGASPFDVLEMKTMDDKALLQQVLDPNGFVHAPLVNSQLERSAAVGVAPSNISTMDPNAIAISSLPRTNYFNDLTYPQPFPQLRPGGLLELELGDTSALKPSKSSPDLTKLDLVQTNGLNGSHRGHSRKPSKDSATGLSLSMESIDLNAQRRSSAQSLEENSVLPTQTTDQERAIVNHLAPMGYPASLIVECSRKLPSTDTRKIVNCLILVESLKQNGLDASLVLDAVLNCNMEEAKARIFARNAYQLRNMGFDQARVVEALRSSDGSRDKALEWLISR